MKIIKSEWKNKNKNLKTEYERLIKIKDQEIKSLKEDLL